MKKLVVNLCRLVLAVVFILSGFVKAVDPLGTQYKIADYLEALHIGSMVPDMVTLGASVVLSAVEFCIGILLLFAIRRRLASRLALMMMLVMTPITLWLALYNPVSDCGCFGDALVLTNWQTLWKNVVLLGCAAVVVWQPLLMFRFVSRSNQWIVINYSVLFILTISVWSLYDLPQFDFRPYHIGADIKAGMEIPEDAATPEFETTFILEKDGRQEEFTIDNYPDSTWTFVDSKTVQTKEGYTPPIHDFSLMLLSEGVTDDDSSGDNYTDDDSDGTDDNYADDMTAETADITDKVLSDTSYVFLLVSAHLEQADDSRLDLINELYEYSTDHDYAFYGLTASTEKGIARWRDMTGAEYPFCNTDEITLKTVIRSNPGLVLLKHGKVIGKWSHNSLPELSEQEAALPLEQLTIGQMPEDTVPEKILRIVLWFVLPLALLTIADRLWMWTRWVRRSDKQGEDSEAPKNITS